ncbi:MAG: FG-GAP repeat domain-containing protein, partial [Planctomycetota bacterium]
MAADINGDGKDEIVLETAWGPSGTRRIHVLNGLGEEESGWPIDLDPSGWIPSGYMERQVGMALGDIDRDGELELVISHSILNFGTVAPSPTFLMNMQGDILPGWPLETYYLSRPTIVDLDLDGDGIPQLILRVRDSGGTHLHGFDLDFEQPGDVEVLWFDRHHSAKHSRWLYH